jgi:F0F1-type ATP synthase assembly protein I
MADPGDRERPDAEQQQEQGLSKRAAAFRSAERYTGAAFSLVAAVGVFTWLGHWADGKLGNETPWLTLLGALVGMVGGFISFFKTVLGKTT